MYRRLKNILGASLMALAVVISQIPMPEAQAVVMKEMTEAELEVDDASAHVVTFSMNGGTFRGDYNDYRFQDKTPVLVIDDGKKSAVFPMISMRPIPAIRQRQIPGIQTRNA